MQHLVQHEPVEDDEDDDGHQVDEEDVGAVDGVLPVLEPHGAVGAQQDGRVRRHGRAGRRDVRLEQQRQRVAAEVVEQQHGHLAHGDPEDQEPADARHDEQRGRQEEVEEEEEDDAADVPLAAAEEPPLHAGHVRVVRLGRMVVVAADAAAAAVAAGWSAVGGAAEQAVGLARLRVDAPARPADDGAVAVGPEEQAAVLEVAALPLLVLADAAALAEILVQVGLLLLQPHELAEGVEQVAGQAPEHAAVLPAAGRGREEEADHGADEGDEGHPPAEAERPYDVEAQEPAADAAARRRVYVALGRLLDRAVLLVQGWLPQPDAERVRLVDGLLPVLEREALGVADVVVIVVVVVVAAAAAAAAIVIGDIGGVNSISVSVQGDPFLVADSLLGNIGADIFGSALVRRRGRGALFGAVFFHLVAAGVDPRQDRDGGGGPAPECGVAALPHGHVGLDLAHGVVDGKHLAAVGRLHVTRRPTRHRRPPRPRPTAIGSEERRPAAAMDWLVADRWGCWRAPPSATNCCDEVPEGGGRLDGSCAATSRD